MLLEDPERDVIGVFVDPFTAAPIAVEFEGISPTRQWLDKKTEARHKALTRAFPERDVWIVDRSENYQRMLVRVEGPSNPPIYYLVDFATGRADIVGEAYPALSEAKLGTGGHSFSRPAATRCFSRSFVDPPGLVRSIGRRDTGSGVA